MAQPNSQQPVNPNYAVGVSHSRSLSQPTFFLSNCLPPLSPSSCFKEASSMLEVDAKSRDQPSYTREYVFQSNENFPFPRGHRRSNSDVPLGFSAVIQSSPQLVPISGQGLLEQPAYLRGRSGSDKPAHLQKHETSANNYDRGMKEVMGQRKSEREVMDGLVCSSMNTGDMDALNSIDTADKDKDSMVGGSKTSTVDSSNTDAEIMSKGSSMSIHMTNSREGVKRSAPSDIAPVTRHIRSLSMDSAIRNLNLGEESLKLPNSLGTKVGQQLSPSYSVTEDTNKLNLEFGNAEFSEAEMKKIMADERLAEIASSDPKRAKRILANRQSAARSKERKLRYISELEHKVQTLQTEATTLSAQITIMQKDFAELTTQNNELKFRLQAMEQQAQLRDALHEALTAEVQRLKMAASEMIDEGRSQNSMTQQISMRYHIFQMHNEQPNQLKQVSAATSTTVSTASATSA